MKSWLQRVVFKRLWLSFVLMGLSFLGFGVGTLNLIYLLQANTEFLLAHGWRALMDGGALQLLELLITAYLSLAAYVLFKACEYRLTHWLAD